MSNFLNSISSVINFLLNQLSLVTNTLITNPVFQLAAGIFIFSLVVAIIGSIIHMRVNGSKIND